MDAPKFSIGQVVQPNDGHAPSEIVAIRHDGSGWTYSVAAKSFNHDTEEVVAGVRHYTEAELGEVITPEPTEEEVTDEPK